MQQFFIDHTHKKTSYMDPRVPTEPLFPRRTSDDNSGVSALRTICTSPIRVFCLHDTWHLQLVE